MIHRIHSPHKGLSPPTRGILRRAHITQDGRRSIPAYAGDPPPPPAHVKAGEVYPRLRGGSSIVNGRITTPSGLSPPTRGIPARAAAFKPSIWSIPAYTGDPGCPRSQAKVREVYPRLRGGSRQRTSQGNPKGGLSPPTRGIPPSELCPLPSSRSIPAYAGDPGGQRNLAGRAAVYPRLRGGSR